MGKWESLDYECLSFNLSFHFHNGPEVEEETPWTGTAWDGPASRISWKEIHTVCYGTGLSESESEFDQPASKDKEFGSKGRGGDQDDVKAAESDQLASEDKEFASKGREGDKDAAVVAMRQPRQPQQQPRQPQRPQPMALAGMALFLATLLRVSFLRAQTVPMALAGIAFFIGIGLCCACYSTLRMHCDLVRLLFNGVGTVRTDGTLLHVFDFLAPLIRGIEGTHKCIKTGNAEADAASGTPFGTQVKKGKQGKSKKGKRGKGTKGKQKK